MKGHGFKRVVRTRECFHMTAAALWLQRVLQKIYMRPMHDIQAKNLYTAGVC